ncbi:hypothetical protein CASFOL_001720 [Castilleja foliolosa]|uniref:Ubiquitin-like protease family profile domain-containing protein n=1 Tax=Castilleja foliolosa TaxID=1961234 RepID=A0ABD3EG91_9LAMI
MNDNTLNDNSGNSGEVNEDLVADSGKTCTDVTGNKVVQDDDETVKVTKNVVDDPPEKHDCFGFKGGEKIKCTSNVDEQVKKAPLKKPSVSKKADKGIVIQEPVVVNAKTTGANSKARARGKGKTIVVADKIVGGGKRRKADVNIPKDLTPKRTKSVLGECSSKKQKTDNADINIYPSLKTRNNGYILIKTFKSMTNEQRDTVRSMGFGGLLDFNIAETPLALGYWLLENFDPMACVVKLQEDGPKTLWFKRPFLVLITTCLVESCDNGYVITRIIPNFEEPDRAKDLNWGQYMKKCLAEEVVDWNKKNRKESFTGPLVFLLALYVDRFDLMDRLVRRVYPSVKGWTCTLLRQREKFEILASGFGRGYPVDRARPEVNENHSTNKNRGPSTVDANAPVRDEGEFKTTASQSAYSFAEALLRKSKLVAETISEIIEMVQSAPVNINENANLKKVVDNTEHLLGCKLERPELAEVTTDAADPINTWENEDFWSDQEIIALMDGIAKGVEKRDKLASGVGRREELRAMAFDSPPFSLGMTQDYPEVVVQQKNDEAGPAKPAKGKRTENTVIKDVDPKGKGKMKVAYEQETQDAQIRYFVEIPSKRVTRNAASMKRSKTGCSTYTLRATMAGDGLNKTEKELCYWVMDNDELDKELIVFDEENFEVIREDIMTLGSGLAVAQSVVDVWSVLMNKKEHLRSPSSPARFFATLDVHINLHTVVYPKEDWSRTDCEEGFVENLQGSFSESAAMKLGEVDIVSMRIDIIDSSTGKEDLPIEAKYEHLPNTLAAYLVNYLEKEGQKTKADRVANSRTFRPPMAWRDDTNPVDCTIYTMRHMETYFGQPPRQWTAGLSNGDRRKQIQFFRAKYCAAIVCDDANTKGKDNLSNSMKYCKQKKIKAVELGLDDVLSNSLNWEN